MATKRYYEIDLARAIPLLFLPIVHVFEEYSAGGFLYSGTESSLKIIYQMCILGPSVFMIVLGMNIAFSTHTSPKELFQRGLKTILYYFLLNAARFGIPTLLGYLFIPEPWVLELAACMMVTSDILMFAGLAFLFFALMRKWKISSFGSLLITLGILCIHMLVSPMLVVAERSVFADFLGNFIYCSETSSFPVMAWLPYPAIGLIMGEYMKTLNEQGVHRFYRRLLLGGTMVLVCFIIGLKSIGVDPETVAFAVSNANRVDFLNIVFDTAVACIWFGLIFYLWNGIHSQRIRSAAVLISRAIMIFYIVQWVFVGWSEIIIGTFSYEEPIMTVGTAVLIALVITVLSLVVTIWIQKKKDAKHRGSSEVDAV